MALHSQGIPMNFIQKDVYECYGGLGVRGRLVYLLWKSDEYVKAYAKAYVKASSWLSSD